MESIFGKTTRLSSVGNNKRASQKINGQGPWSVIQKLSSKSKQSHRSCSSIDMSYESDKVKNFKIVREKTYNALNPSSSQDLDVRSDILRDFESDSERERREEMEH